MTSNQDDHGNDASSFENIGAAKRMGNYGSEPVRELVRDAMNRYASGDDSVFPQVHAHLAPKLFRFLFRHTHDVDRTADLLQQTLLRLHRARARFIPDADVVPWAIAIARRILIDNVRAQKRWMEPTDWPRGASAEPSMDELLHAKRIAEVFEHEVLRLPETQRRAFCLTADEDLSTSEAGKLLGTTSNAVKVRTHRARLTLKAAMVRRFGHAR